MRMRRRERIILISILLSTCLYVTQLVPAEWRFWAIGALGVITYLASAFALKDDLQIHEWLTILPFPTMYSVALGVFYFLLPENFLTKILVLVVFALGMYGILLTCNIFSVSKGRTIQLHNAAKTMSLFVAMLISLLLMNTLFSLKLPFWLNGGLAMVAHLPLVYTLAWAVNLESRVTLENTVLGVISALVIGELAMILSFLPFQEWTVALFIMALFYLIIGILQSFLTGKQFKRSVGEHALLAVFVIIVFVILFPGK